jgi:hypothetical protein
MAISGIQIIGIGQPNESANSDSLYTAFTKTKDNFTQLFACASPYNTFTGNGVTITQNSGLGTVNIDNNGVLDITAGSGISITSANGVYEISSNGSGNGGSGTVTSVGIASSTINVGGTNPVTSSGTITLNLPIFTGLAGTYNNPTVTLDAYGRVTSASNNTVSGTVTSVAMSPGNGIQVSVTGNSNVNPTFTVTNTGVTRLTAGTGISLSGSNGAITVATTGVGTVTGVSVTSNALVVTGSPVTTSGTITVDLPSNIAATGSTTVGTFLKLTPQASAPTSPTAGTVYYDSGTNTLKCYNGTAWKTITMA